MSGVIKSRTAIYQVWAQMRQRCENAKDKKFPTYGGRGVTVCERWRSFDNFLADMGERPSPEHQLDRIDNDGHYEPGNVRWATRLENHRNRRVTRFVEFNGERRPLPEWAKLCGVNYKTLHSRLENGWSVKDALTTKARR